MAQVLKRRSLINSGKRRRKVTVRRRKNGPKRMTAKQIKYFGTARQKAALRASGGRRRRANAGKNSIRKSKKRLSRAPVKLYKTRAHTTKFKRRLKKRRKNVGAIYSIGLAGLMGSNPGRKRKRKVVRKSTSKRRVGTMARRRRARKVNAGHRRLRRRRTNRAAKVVVRYRTRRRRNSGRSYRRRRAVGTHRRRRNAGGISGAASGATGMLKNAFGVIGGAVATRYATQLALGANNTGVMGYVGNAVAALVIGWGAKKFLKSPQLGMMVTLGGFTGLALRMLSDLTPIGNYVNLSLNGAGKAGDTGIGLITDTTFYVPTVFSPGSMTQSQIPSQLSQMIAAGSVGKSGAGVGSYRRNRARLAA